MQGRLGDHSAGTPAEADHNFQAAQALLESCIASRAAASPLRSRAQFLLAEVLGHRQELAVSVSADHEAAGRMLARKLAILQALAEAEGENIRARLEVANTYNEMGWLHNDDPKVFREHSALAPDMLEDLARRHPQEKGANAILANVLLARAIHELAYAPGAPGDAMRSRSHGARCRCTRCLGPGTPTRPNTP